MLVAKVVVGSRLHGLDTPESDYDYRGIYMSPLVDVLSPFKSLGTTSFIDDKVDNVSYELANFCKQAVGGNVTCLEVFFSDQIITTSTVHEVMQQNWRKFFDTKKFIAASKGYSESQRKQLPGCRHHPGTRERRSGKIAATYLRVMWQCEQFLQTGKFECSMIGSDLYPLLKKIKHIMIDDIWEYMPEIREAMRDIELRVKVAEANTKYIYEPDIEWIEKFILQAYTGQYDD